MHFIFKNHNDGNITSDSIMRARFVATNKNKERFEYLFQLLLSLDFIWIIDNLNTTFQDPKKSVSILIEITNQSISILKAL